MYAVSHVNATEQSLRVGEKSELYQILLNVYNFLRGLQAVQRLCLHKFKGQGHLFVLDLLSWLFSPQPFILCLRKKVFRLEREKSLE